MATSQPSNTTGDNITHANHFDSTQPRTSTPPTNNLDTNSPMITPTKQSSFYNQTGKNENIDTLRSQNHTPPPMTSSLLYTDSPSPSKLNNHNPNYSFGKYSSYSNSRKSPLPPALQSKNTLQDLQGLLSVILHYLLFLFIKKLFFILPRYDQNSSRTKIQRGDIIAKY